MSVFFNLLNRPLAHSVWAHAAGTVLSVLAFGGVKSALDASYLASQHPVDFVTGQTGFSASLVKSYYAQMSEAGTLGIYFKTQLIDFGFIAMMALTGLMLGTLIARLGVAGGFGRKLGFAAALCVMTGAGFDAMENFTSFVMLADPADFADWIAMPYSAFAVAKFGFIILGMGLAVLSLLRTGYDWARSVMRHQYLNETHTS